MSASHFDSRLTLPDSLAEQLLALRRRVWKIKSIEAAAGAVFGMAVGYLSVYGRDRLVDTPMGVRLAIFLTSLVGCAIVPDHLHQWIWRQRTLDQLARLI